MTTRAGYFHNMRFVTFQILVNHRLQGLNNHKVEIAIYSDCRTKIFMLNLDSTQIDLHQRAHSFL